MTIAGRRATSLTVGGSRVNVVFSDRSDGDFRLPDGGRITPDLEARRRSLVDLPWSQPDEVHGTSVLVVDEPGRHDGCAADGLVTRCDRAVLGIWVGDCAPVALVGDAGTVAAVHAGWRGAAAGVLEVAVDAVRRWGDRDVTAILGPCIHPCCYRFDDADLDPVVRRFGRDVEGRTTAGERALDMPAFVRAVLRRTDVTLDARLSECTGCSPGAFFSHRVRGERQRQVMAVWRDGTSL